MTTDPRWLSCRDAIVTALEGMSEDAGYHHDYGPVATGGAVATWDRSAEKRRNTVYVAWIGPVGQGDSQYGFEMPAGRSRPMDVWRISVAFRYEDDPELWAARFRADVHAALMGGDRTLGVAGTLVTDTGEGEWVPARDGDRVVGGSMAVAYIIRWDHRTGDMATR
jgi:hypothetical protein